jgi:uncharacterized protein (DUF1810 family)
VYDVDGDRNNRCEGTVTSRQRQNAGTVLFGDEDSLRLVISMILRKARFFVSEAAEGNAAIDLL